MIEKKCRDCGEKFIAKSNRSVRCELCQKKERKRQKAVQRKKTRRPRTVDGRAEIRTEEDIWRDERDTPYQPISHRMHQVESSHAYAIENIAGHQECQNLYRFLIKECKYESKRVSAFRDYKKGKTKTEIKKKYNLTESYYNEIIREMKEREANNDDRNRIQELRTKMTFLNDWAKIKKRIELDSETDLVRFFNDYIRDIPDGHIYDYIQYTSKSPEIKEKAKYHKDSYLILDDLSKIIEEIREEAIEEHGYEEVNPKLFGMFNAILEFRGFFKTSIW